MQSEYLNSGCTYFRLKAPLSQLLQRSKVAGFCSAGAVKQISFNFNRNKISAKICRQRRLVLNLIIAYWNIEHIIKNA